MSPRSLWTAAALAIAAASQAQLHISAHIHAGAKVGANAVQVHLSDHAGNPVKDATVGLSVNMTTMDMGTQRLTATNNADGTYSANVRFTMAGPWRVTVEAKSPTAGESKQDFVFTTSEGEMHEAHAMRGRLGAWSMSKEGSGTTWLPLSSPMNMKHLGMAGRYEQSAMGFITYNFTDAGGDRGEQRFYSNSMLMLMGVNARERETSGYSVMLSLDPLFNGRYGYPNLFQTGETAYGAPLTDFQHPHDLFVEVAGTYSRELSPGMRGFVYVAPVGEPALGGPTFMHRPSGVEIPEAPIGHHWFDATHISWGVITLGANTDRWQLEGSVFNGHEPDENRYSPDNISLNSVSGRFTHAPSNDFVWNLAYGFLDEPESLEPGVHQHRVTASALWNKALAGGANLAVGAAFGRNYKEGEFGDALLLEATYSRGDDTFFARWEGVDKDELTGVPAGTYRVNKFLLGGVREVSHFDGLDLGVGGYVGFYSFPSSLEPFYGKSPLTVGAFVRLRPSRMQSPSQSMHSGH
jgi:nitrogen fixation protein FixH